MSKEYEGKGAQSRSTRSAPPVSGRPSASSLASWRPSAQLPPVERYGRFEILGRIGRGGMAEILLARERSLTGGTRHLVIKRVLPEVRDFDELMHMFLDETRVVMDLSHPNLCQIFEVGEQDGAWFIAMEWVNGVTLHQLSRRARHFSAPVLGADDWAVLARVGAQCADALHYAHTVRDAQGELKRLIHRDVSPHNLMVAYDGRVKLLDFGIAKSNATTHQTEAGVVKGKICYMAPEQWLSQPLDARTDVFALGVTLYEAFSGKIALKRENQLEVMKAALSGDVQPLATLVPELPPALIAIVERAMATRPEERFQSAREMSEALELFLASLGKPTGAARISAYTRQLFAQEVQLGPVLERSLRGAQIQDALSLPPLATLGALSSSSLPPPVTISASPSALASDAATERARLKSSPPAADASDHATRPAIPSLPEAQAGARPLARTLSMRVGRRAKLSLFGATMIMAAVAALLLVRGQQSEGGAVMVRSHEDAPTQRAAPAFTTMPAGVHRHDDNEEHEADAESLYAGRLSINTRPWSTVYLGKRALGTTPLADVPVPRGTLTLKMVDRDGQVHIRRVAPGKKRNRAVHFEF